MVAAAKSATIHERMVAILDRLPAIGKDQRNEQQKFMYRGFDDVMAALNPLLAKNGVFVVPEVLERETAQRATRSGGVMFEVNLHVRYTFYGEAGDSVTASAWGEGTDSGDKSTNKAMTMAFKNVLNQSFAISTREDIDADALTPEESVGRGAGSPPPAPEGKNTGPTDDALFALLAETVQLVEERGGDAAVFDAAVETARTDSTVDFAAWLQFQHDHWLKQPVATEFDKKAADAIASGAKAAQERAAQAQAGREKPVAA